MAVAPGVERNRTVVLVHPCATSRQSVQPWCDLPLELIAVGSPLARKGYRVRIIDQRVDARWREELVAAIEQGGPVGDIAGVWRKEGGRVVHGPERTFIDLDAEPPLEYDLVDVAKYTRTVFGVRRLSFSTSRGCTYPCAFCYSTVVHRRRFRAMTPDVAVERIKAFTGRYGVRGVFPTDANFFLDLDRARAILEGVVRERLGLVFTRLHIRFDMLRRLTDEDLTLFERAGVKCLALGVESGSSRIRGLLHKPIDEGDLHEVNDRFRRTSIMPMYFFMLGFPTETKQDLRSTVQLFMKLSADNPAAYVSVNVYAPFPGTALFDLAVAEGLTPPSTLEDWYSFSYRSLGARGAWLSAPIRKTVEMLDFCSFFASDRGYVVPFKETHPLATAAARAYAPFARFRMRHLIHQLPVEITAARKLGLYGHAG